MSTNKRRPAMNDDTLRDIIGPVIEIANHAAEAILKIYDTEFTVERKDDHTPLTKADMAAHHIICDGLSALQPKFPVLSEESADIPFKVRASWPRYWLVDPLDGTREFIKRNGEFTVNIALIENHRPILGVILVPVSRVCYFAARGMGAFKQLDQEPAAAIHARPCLIEDDTIIVAGSRSHRDDSLVTFLQNIGNHELISMGSSLKSCMVAEGAADIYPRLGPTSEWDTAAAQCIVEEAGGFLTDLALEPMRYNTKESLLNPDFLVFGDDNIDWRKYL